MRRAKEAADKDKYKDSIDKLEARIKQLKESKGQWDTRIRDVASVMFGEFGTHPDIGTKDYPNYARVVGYSIRNRIGQKEWARHKDYKSVIEKTGYDAVTGNTPAYQIAKWGLGKAPINQQWRKLRSSMNHDEYISRLRKLIDSIGLACTTQAIRKVPATYKGLVLYYSPSGMEGGKTPKWSFDKLEEIKVDGTSTDHIRAYRYK